jgi:hypothetical protein
MSVGVMKDYKLKRRNLRASHTPVRKKDFWGKRKKRKCNLPNQETSQKMFATITQLNAQVRGHMYSASVLCLMLPVYWCACKTFFCS